MATQSAGEELIEEWNELLHHTGTDDKDKDNLKQRFCGATVQAAQKGCWDWVMKLASSAPDSQSKHMCCAIVIAEAVSTGHTDEVKNLIELTEFGTRDKSCLQAIEPSIQHKQWKMVSDILDLTQAPAAKDTCCEKALEPAAQNQQWQLVSKIMEITENKDVRAKCLEYLKTVGTLSNVKLQLMAEWVIEEQEKEQASKEQVTEELDQQYDEPEMTTTPKNPTQIPSEPDTKSEESLVESSSEPDLCSLESIEKFVKDATLEELKTEMNRLLNSKNLGTIRNMFHCTKVKLSESLREDLMHALVDLVVERKQLCLLIHLWLVIERDVTQQFDVFQGEMCACFLISISRFEFNLQSANMQFANIIMQRLNEMKFDKLCFDHCVWIHRVDCKCHHHCVGYACLVGRLHFPALCIACNHGAGCACHHVAGCACHHGAGCACHHGAGCACHHGAGCACQYSVRSDNCEACKYLYHQERTLTLPFHFDWGMKSFYYLEDRYLSKLPKTHIIATKIKFAWAVRNRRWETVIDQLSKLPDSSLKDYYCLFAIKHVAVDSDWGKEVQGIMKASGLNAGTDATQFTALFEILDRNDEFPDKYAFFEHIINAISKFYKFNELVAASQLRTRHSSIPANNVYLNCYMLITAVVYVLQEKDWSKVLKILQGVTDTHTRDFICKRVTERATAEDLLTNAVQLVKLATHNQENCCRISLKTILQEHALILIEQSHLESLCELLSLIKSSEVQKEMIDLLVNFITYLAENDKWDFAFSLVRNFQAHNVDSIFSQECISEMLDVAKRKDISKEIMTKIARLICDAKIVPNSRTSSIRVKKSVKNVIRLADKGNWDSAIDVINDLKDPALRYECFTTAALHAVSVSNWTAFEKILDSAENKIQCIDESLKCAVTLDDPEILNKLIEYCDVDDYRRSFLPRAILYAAEFKNIVFHMENPDTSNCVFCQIVLDTLGSSGYLCQVQEILKMLRANNKNQNTCVGIIHVATSNNWNKINEKIQLQDNKNCDCSKCVLLMEQLQNPDLLSIDLSSLKNDQVHLCRDKCCDLGLRKTQVSKNWELYIFLLVNISNSETRNIWCRKGLPLAVKYGQCSVVYSIIRLISDADLQLVSTWCCKLSPVIGIQGRLSLFKRLVFLLKYKFKCKTLLKRFYHKAFIGSLKGRNREILNYIIKSRYKPDFTDADILHFLANKVLHENYELIEIICKDLSSPCLDDECNKMMADVLLRSMSEGHVSLASAILKYSDLSSYRTDGGQTILMIASMLGHLEIVGNLLRTEQIHDVDSQDKHGRTALSWACIKGHLRIIRILVDNGANLCHWDENGKSCLDYLKIDTRMNEFADKRWDIAKRRFAFSQSKQTGSQTENKAMSLRLHSILNAAGFTQERAKMQQEMANFLEKLARKITKEDWHITGSYSDGWGNSLVQVNGITADDSDIDWTVILGSEQEDEKQKLIFHLDGNCKCPNVTTHLQVVDGHAMMTSLPPGSQPAMSAASIGVRPAQDTCHAYECCSNYSEHYSEHRVRVLLPADCTPEHVHLVSATRPSFENEMRLSFSFEEKKILRQLSTVQGQLFVLIKFIFKRLLPKKWRTSGLKTYHARTLLFFMLEKYSEPHHWEPQNLVFLLKESINEMLRFMTDQSTDNQKVCMPHFFMKDSFIYLKDAGIEGLFTDSKLQIVRLLRDIANDVSLVEESITTHVKPLKSEHFHFHPFALLPLTVPPDASEVEDDQFARIYCIVFQCLTELHEDLWDEEVKSDLLKLTQSLPDCCKSARLCLTVIIHLKSNETEKAKDILRLEENRMVLRRLSVDDVENLGNIESDWLWRFCFIRYSSLKLDFLPEFCRNLFNIMTPVQGPAHLYVNFRCLFWSLQAELLNDWYLAVKWDKELRDNPQTVELQEMQTLRWYSEYSSAGVCSTL